jgi:poly(3-hydroxybutyrate) depolymerase
VSFITDLAKSLQHDYGLDPNNTFATGMSNGADLCVLLACKTKGIFKGIAPVCGSIMKKTFDDTPAVNPIPALSSTAQAIAQLTGWGTCTINKDTGLTYPHLK